MESHTPTGSSYSSSAIQENPSSLPYSPCRRCGSSFVVKRQLLEHVKTNPRCTRNKDYIRERRKQKEMEYTRDTHQQQFSQQQPLLLQGFGGADGHTQDSHQQQLSQQSLPLQGFGGAVSVSAQHSSTKRLPLSARLRTALSSTSSSSSSDSTSSFHGGIPIDSPTADRPTFNDGSDEGELHQEEPRELYEREPHHKIQYQEEPRKVYYDNRDNHDKYNNSSGPDYSSGLDYSSYDDDSDY